MSDTDFKITIEADAAKASQEVGDLAEQFETLQETAGELASGSAAQGIESLSDGVSGLKENTAGATETTNELAGASALAGGSAQDLAGREQALVQVLQVLAAQLKDAKQGLVGLADEHKKTAESAKLNTSSIKGVDESAKGLRETVSALSAPFDTVWMVVGKVTRAMALVNLALDIAAATKNFISNMDGIGDSADQAARKVDAAWRVIEYDQKKKTQASQSSTDTAIHSATQNVESADNAEAISQARAKLNEELTRLTTELAEARRKSNEAYARALAARGQSDAAIADGKDASKYKSSMDKEISIAEFYDRIASEISDRVEKRVIPVMESIRVPAGMPQLPSDAYRARSEAEGYTPISEPDASIPTYGTPAGGNTIQRYNTPQSSAPETNALQRAAEAAGAAKDETSAAGQRTADSLDELAAAIRSNGEITAESFAGVIRITSNQTNLIDALSKNLATLRMRVDAIRT